MLDAFAAELHAGQGGASCIGAGTGPGPGWDWLPDSAGTSGTGLALLDHADGRRSAIAPPFPITSSAEGLAPLRDVLVARHTVGVILLRLGRYAVGVADDETLLVPKAGHRYVKGRHRAGGQSQHRFEHNREKWIRELYDEVCETAASKFHLAPKPLDWLALGGDHIVLAGFMKRCAALGALRDKVLPWRVPVSEPGLDALHAAVRAVWSSRIYTNGPALDEKRQ
jgi:peptide subunit release factor 1 (eRF1)